MELFLTQQKHEYCLLFIIVASALPASEQQGKPLKCPHIILITHTVLMPLGNAAYVACSSTHLPGIQVA